MEQREINEYLEKGYIHVRAIVEVVGKPKEYVEDAINKHLEKIRKKFIIIFEDTAKASEEESFFSTFSEIELLFKNPKKPFRILF